MALLTTQFDHWRKQTINEKSSFQEKLELLENKLNKTTKNLTSWDFYKISDVVYYPSEYDAKWANLLPNTGLIINSDSFNVGEFGLRRGDIVFKQDDLTPIHIKAENGGILYPSKITEVTETTVDGEEQPTGKHALHFKFTGQTPTKAESTSSIGDETEAEAAKTITLSGLTSPSITSIYGNILIPQDKTVFFPQKKDKDNKNVIKPFVKFFTLVDNTNYEEVYWDFSLSVSGSNFQITNIPSIVKQVVVK